MSRIAAFFLGAAVCAAASAVGPNVHRHAPLAKHPVAANRGVTGKVAQGQLPSGGGFREAPVYASWIASLNDVFRFSPPAGSSPHRTMARAVRGRGLSSKPAKVPATIRLPAETELAPERGEVTVAETSSEACAPKVGAGNPDLCYLDMQDADVKSVLKGLARQHDKNLVFASEPASKRTLTLNGVSFEEVLTQVTRYDGMTWHKDGDVYVVGTQAKVQEMFPETKPAPEVKPEPPPPNIVTTVYMCDHVSATEAAKMLVKLLPFATSRNKILMDSVFGIASPTSPNELALEIELAPTALTPGLADTQSSQTGMSANPVKPDTGSDPNTRRIFLHGPEDMVNAALDALRATDKPRRQVSIRVTIHDISSDALKDLGLSWSWSTLGLRENTTSGPTFGKFSRPPFNIDATLSALETQGAAKLLAEPSITVLDGEKGFVLIGQRLLFPVFNGTTSAGTPTYDVRQELVGIYLQVAPVITKDGEIYLAIYPQVSSVTGYLQQNGGSYPQISTREAQTTLRVKNGQAIVLGGLISQEEITALDRVPGLSQIPLFGKLFEHRKKTKSKSEVVIVLVPTILEEPEVGDRKSEVGQSPGNATSATRRAEPGTSYSGRKGK